MAYLQKSAIPVASGGTGAITFTAYAPICAGTTATGAWQSASSGQSNSGYVLTSTGSSSLPTWQQLTGIATINGDSGSVSNPTITLTGGTSGAVFTGATTTMTESFNFLALPTTTSTNGQILINSNPVFHTYGTQNTFVGQSAGNFTLTTASSTNNTALGASALTALTTGNNNVAAGYQAGTALTTGARNVILGSGAGSGIITGGSNVIAGYQALPASGTTAISDTIAIGYQAMNSCTGTGQDVAIGYQALSNMTSGNSNVVLGYTAGSAYTTSESANIVIGSSVPGTALESNTLRIGAGTGTGTGQIHQAFVSGIQGITVTGSAVLVSSSDQLGVAVSSERFKENIHDITDESSKILQLRPVSFNYISGEDRSTQTGLIAEEVAKVLPQLIVYDKEGLPFTVKYQDLPVLILNEMKKAVARIDDLEKKVSLKNKGI